MYTSSHHQVEHNNQQIATSFVIDVGLLALLLAVRLQCNFQRIIWMHNYRNVSMTMFHSCVFCQNIQTFHAHSDASYLPSFK